MMTVAFAWNVVIAQEIYCLTVMAQWFSARSFVLIEISDRRDDAVAIFVYTERVVLLMLLLSWRSQLLLYVMWWINTWFIDGFPLCLKQIYLTCKDTALRHLTEGLNKANFYGTVVWLYCLLGLECFRRSPSSIIFRGCLQNSSQRDVCGYGFHVYSHLSSVVGS